jgi:hypothetical protein
MNSVLSINKVLIRLPNERWVHITMGHPEIAEYYFEVLETIQAPDEIYEGKGGELLATKIFSQLNGKFVVVVYKELSADDGFVITAYISNKKQEFLKRNKIWVSQR